MSEWVARGLFQLVMPPNPSKPWLGNTTNFEAIWTARAGGRPPGFDPPRAKRYAQVLKQRIAELKEESAGIAKPEHHVGRMKGLAVLLAALDGRESANVVLETLTPPPSQWDAYARMNGIRALLVSGATLRLDSVNADRKMTPIGIMGTPSAH
jgi:hypothetical protein